MKSNQDTSVMHRKDYGFFEPDSITRKIWCHPAAPVIGLQRAVVIEELDPKLLAAVQKTGANYDRPATRYARTIRYFAAVAFADSETVLKMADILVKVHSTAIGIEPVSGNRYDANDPDSQLWILITGWHSVMKAYEVFGPGPLTEEEDRQWWADCAIAAELQTCNPADVPRNRAEVRAYFDSWRPKLAASEATLQMMHFLLDNAAEVLPNEGVIGMSRHAFGKLIRASTIATMPEHMRRLAGLKQSKTTDKTTIATMRAAMKMLNASLSAQRKLFSHIAPTTLPILEAHWQQIIPDSPVVRTPAEAREMYGYVRPAEAHLEWRAKQEARVFGEGKLPSDAGIMESQAALGTIAV